MRSINTLINTCLLLLCISTAIAQSNAQTELGFQKLEAREYSAAIDIFSQALRDNPTDTLLLSGIIRAYTMSENFREAQNYIENAIRAHPNNPEFYLRRGILNNFRNQFRRAIADFDVALSLTQGQGAVIILINRGISYSREEDYARAFEDFSNALTLSPNNVMALSQRGFANFRLGNFNEAIHDFDRALEIDPENAMNFYNRGMTYLRLENRGRACSDFHRSCSRGNMNACRMIRGECAGVRQE